MGILQRITGRKDAAPAALAPQQTPTAPRRDQRIRAATPSRLDGPVHLAAPPAAFTDGHWWSATPRLIVSGSTFVAGASLRAASVAEAEGRFGDFVLAQIAADPSNPHDDGAVAVWIGDLHVGYIRRDVLNTSGARTLRRLLEAEPPVTVWAHIESVADKRGDHLGVTLHHELAIGASKKWPFPVACPPIGHAKVIGADAVAADLLQRMQTAKSTDRTNLTRPELTLPALLTLTQYDGAQQVDVSVEGARIGSLSTQESARRLAVVQKLLEAGREPTASLRLRADESYSRLTASLLCLTVD